MSITNKYPYTDFHELNADWIISKIRELSNEWAEMKVEFNDLNRGFEDLKNYISNYFAQLDVQNEINNKIDQMAADGFFDDLFERVGLYYATPQMHKTATNTWADAFEMAMNSGKIVYIPNGYYPIERTVNLHSEKAPTVKAGNKAVIYATNPLDRNRIKPFGEEEPQFVGTCMFRICSFNGYNISNGSWEGGTIDCSNVPNMNAFELNIYAPAFTFKDAKIYNVGNNSIGIYIDGVNPAQPNVGTSTKFYLNNVYVYGFPIIYSVTEETTRNVTLGPIDFTKTNTGIKINNSFDFSMGTIYTMGVTVGIEAVNSAQVHINYFHYWVGSDGNTQIPLEQYAKTRGVKLDNNSYYIFDMIYPDKPYIGIEGGSVTANNVHYISPFKSMFVNPDGVECYLGNMTNIYAGYDFRDVDINWSNDRVHYRGIKTQGNSLVPYRRGALRIKYAFPESLPTKNDYPGENYLEPSFAINNSDTNIPCHLSATNTWYIIGYACSAVDGMIELTISNPQNLCSGYAKIIAKTYGGKILDARNYKGSQNFDNYIGLGRAIRDSANNYWIPILFKTDFANFTAAGLDIRISTNKTNSMPFIFANSEEYTDTINQSVTFVNEAL